MKLNTVKLIKKFVRNDMPVFLTMAVFLTLLFELGRIILPNIPGEIIVFSSYFLAAVGLFNKKYPIIKTVYKDLKQIKSKYHYMFFATTCAIYLSIYINLVKILGICVERILIWHKTFRLKLVK